MQDWYKKPILQSVKPLLVFFFIILISSIVLAEQYNDPITYSRGDRRWCQLTGCNYTGSVYAQDWLLWNGSSCCQGGAAGVSAVTGTSPIVSSGGTTPDISWNPINIALGWGNITNVPGFILGSIIINWINTNSTFDRAYTDTRVDSMDNISNSSILDLTSVYNDTTSILWENSTGVIKAKSSQDMDMQDGDISIKDSDGEYHNISRDLQIADEMARNITLTGLNGTLGPDANLTITTISGNNIIVNIDKSESILNRNTDSIIITSGTNESPVLTQVVYTNATNPVLTKRTALSLTSPSVAAFLQGANFTFASAVGLATTDNLIGGLFNRFFRDGSTYRSGFDFNVSTNMVNISTGVISFLFSEIEIIQNHSTSDLYVHVHEDGSFHLHVILNDCVTYNDGSAISNNKYFNIVFGIAITHDGKGVMYTTTQDKPSTEYTKAIDAEVDVEDTINFFPADEIVSLAYIPVIRVVARLSGGVNTIQTLSNGLLFDDLRGTLTKTSASPPPSGITSHPDLTNLDFASARHTGFASTEGLVNETIIRTGNTTWINDNEADPIHNLTLDDNLTSWWRMDDVSGSTVIDFTGRNNGTLKGDASQTDGILGKSITMDGIGDYINITGDGSLNVNFTEMSVSFWVKPNFIQTDGTNYRTFDKLKAGLGSYRGLFVASEDDWRFQTATTSGTINCDTQGLTWSIDTWHIFTGTYNGTNMSVYWDGDLENTCAQTGNITGGNSLLIIGAGWDGLDSFKGEMDDFRIYNRSLSQSEITQLYELGELDATTQLDRAYYKEYVATRSLFANFGNILKDFFVKRNLKVGNNLTVNDNIISDTYGFPNNQGKISGTSGEEIIISANTLRLTGSLDNDLIVGGDLDVTGKVSYGDLDPETIQHSHTSRQETIDKYKNWACEGVPQTVEFYNIETGYKEFYYPLLGEFRDSASANYIVLLKLDTPIYNKNCLTKYKWNYIYGGGKEYKQSSKDYKFRVPNDKLLNETTGELQDIPIIDEIEIEGLK